MTTEKLHSKPIEIIFLGLATILVAITILFSHKSFIIAAFAVVVFLALISWIISRLGFQYYFFLILALILPLSIEFSITDSVKLFIPGEPMLAIAIFVLGWEVLKKPSLIRELFSGESKWIIPFLFSFLISLAFSSMILVSAKFSIINFSYILVFFLWQKLLFKNRPEFFPKLILLFSISQLLVVAFSIYQFSGFDWNPVTVKGIFRPFYKDHTIFGAASALLSAFWFLFATKANISKLKLLFVVFGIIFLVGVILSFSRAAFLSFVFFVFVWIILKNGVRVKHISVAVLLGILLIGLYQNKLIQFVYSNKSISYDSNSNYIDRIESSVNITTDISNVERLNRWYSGLKMTEEKPITGFGPGTYQFKYIPYQNPKLMNRLTVKNHWHIPNNSGGTAHSEYVLAMSEMGVFGLTTLLLLIGRWFWIAFEKGVSHPQRKNMIIAFAVLSTYLFHAAFNNFLNTDKLAFLFWGFAAWLVANYELKSDTRKYDELEIL